jgi:WD40 repeat protein
MISPLAARPAAGGSLLMAWFVAAAALAAAGAPPRADGPVPASGGAGRLPAATPPADYRAKWAIIIGIDNYGFNTGLDALDYAVNDAREIRDVLRDEFGYEDDRIYTLFDEEASRGAIEEVFRGWLKAQDLQPNDSLLVFFAGHGQFDRRNGRGYVAAAGSHEARLEADWIAVDTLVGWMEDHDVVRCRHKLLVLDSCYSGALFERERVILTAPADGSGTPGRSDPKDDPHREGDWRTPHSRDRLSVYFQEPAFLGMSAGRVEPVADGQGERQHSIFTATLLEIVRDERADSAEIDQAFTFTEVATRVEGRVRSTLGVEQIPDWGYIGRGRGDFVFRPSFRRPTPHEIRLRQRYTREVNSAFLAWETGSVRLAERLLDRQVDDTVRADLRDFSWFYLFREMAGNHRRWDFSDGTIHGSVDGVAFTPDGGALIAGRRLGNVLVWSPSQLAPPVEFQTGPISSLALTSDGSLLAVENSVRGGNTLSIWDYNNKKFKYMIDNRDFSDFAFSKDGRRLAVGSTHDVTVYETERGGELFRMDMDGFGVESVAFAPNGETLAVGSFYKYVTLWDLEAKTCLRKFEDIGPIPGVPGDYKQPAYDHPVLFSEDGRLLAAGSRGRVRLWDPATGEKLGELNGPPGPVTALAMSGDKLLASANYNNTISVWDIGTCQETANLKGHTLNARSLAFSPDGGRLASAGQDGTVFLWDLGSIFANATIEGRCWIDGAFALSPDGSTLLAKTPDGRTRVWDVAAGQSRALIDGDLSELGGRLVNPQSLVMARDGSLLAAVRRDGTLVIVDVAAGRGPTPLHVETTPNVLVMGSDGLSLVINDDDGDGKVWNLAEDRPRFAIGHGPVRTAEFSPDGKLLMTIAGDQAVRVWDVASGDELPPFRRAGEAHTLVFSPDGTTLATLSGGEMTRDFVYRASEVVIWNVAARTERCRLRFDSTILGCRFSPDGRMLAISIRGKYQTIFRGAPQDPGELSLWDAVTGREHAVLIGHISRVSALDFSPDGRTLASVADTDMKLWDVATGQEMLTLKCPNNLDEARFTPDGRTIVVLGQPRSFLFRAASEDDVRAYYSAKAF